MRYKIYRGENKVIKESICRVLSLVSVASLSVVMIACWSTYKRMQDKRKAAKQQLTVFLMCFVLFVSQHSYSMSLALNNGTISIWEAVTLITLTSITAFIGYVAIKAYMKMEVVIQHGK